MIDQSFHAYLLDLTHSQSAEKTEVIQELWSGYGEIARYQLRGSAIETIIVKHIALNKASQHPRGWNTPKSHERKERSYHVEMNWYADWGRECDDNYRIPNCLGVYSDGDEHWIMMEDLDRHYPVRLDKLQPKQAGPCLKWLANFHATFLNKKPEGLWETGTYWHLNTRPDEWKRLEEGELKSKAHLIDQKLNGAKYQTIIHGDAKLDNFCFSTDSAEVAAVDFQYVGGGCGMKDVAYFLGSAFTGEECEVHEERFLSFYFGELRKALENQKSNINLDALEQEWRELYPFACADFMRFMLGWMPTHGKVNQYKLKKVQNVLHDF